MKVSVIATVLNEEKSIRKFLDSLISQTRKPDEIVIVDGFSSDTTIQILKEYSKKHAYIRIFQRYGNIAQGRNAAITEAKYDIIAQIDAGCWANNHWLERIVEPFKDSSVGLVAGFYDMQTHTDFQKAVAPFLGTTPRKFDPENYLPSGRSMAFRKSVWEKVDGYPERLRWGGEDTLFMFNIVQSNISIVRIPSAYVFWEVPATFRAALRKFYLYALGDAQTNIWWHPGKQVRTHNIKILTIYIRYIILFLLSLFAMFSPVSFLLMMMSFFVYVFWAIWKHLDDVSTPSGRLWLPAIQIGSDFAIMSGFAVGMKNRPNNKA